VSPQHEDEVIEEAEDPPTLVHKPHKPCRPDMIVQIEVADELCHVMTSQREVPTPIRDILHVEHISTTWRCFPRDMMMLMCHIVGSINLIDMLRGGAHDPTTSSSSTEPSTSSMS
jgi:hypothetical protein